MSRRGIGWMLAGFGVVVALLGLTLPDTWFLVVGAVPVLAGLAIGTGLVPASRGTGIAGGIAAVVGLALVVLGVLALFSGPYGILAAVFVAPPGAVLAAIGLALLALRRSARTGPAASADGVRTGP